MYGVVQQVYGVGSPDSLHSQFMTSLQVGQVLSCWSNVSRLRFDQHVGQLTNFWQLVTLTLTKIWLTYDQDMTMTLVKSSPKSTPSNDHDMTNIRPRFDQVFLVKVMSVIMYIPHRYTVISRAVSWDSRLASPGRTRESDSTSKDSWESPEHWKNLNFQLICVLHTLIKF